jgi:hypothetical protein
VTFEPSSNVTNAKVAHARTGFVLDADAEVVSRVV